MNLLTITPIYQSNMVIQRQKPIHIWGTAPASSEITILFCSDSYKTVSEQGIWKCVLPAREATTGCTLTVSCTHTDTQPIHLENISIGDIWLACGQSNMEFFLRYDKDWEEVKKYEKNPNIHMYNIPQLAFEGHKRNTDGYGKWIQEGEEGFDKFSSPGYSFARNIQPHIQVPIGIIGCNWGGSSAIAWLDECCLEEEPLNIYLKEYENAVKEHTPEELERLSLEGWIFEDSEKHINDFMPLLYGRDRKWQEQYMEDHANDPVIPQGPWNINRPGGLYHQMLEPLIPFSVKGVLWYQGESDTPHADIYNQLFTKLITWWRQKWNDEIPFLFVQLAPFGIWLHCDANNYTVLRQQQELVSKTVSNTAMISIMDIGSYYDIHPKQKMEVGRRLALLARGKVYGEDILCESPEFTKIERQGHTLTLTFLHCTSLTYPETEEIKGFVLTQNQQTIAIDSITINGNSISITASSLSEEPCTISLAWADYAEVNLYNEQKLPIKPFITTI